MALGGHDESGLSTSKLMKALETMGETITKPELKVRTTVIEALKTLVAGTSGMRRRTSTDTPGPTGRQLC